MHALAHISLLLATCAAGGGRRPKWDEKFHFPLGAADTKVSFEVGSSSLAGGAGVHRITGCDQAQQHASMPAHMTRQQNKSTDASQPLS
jgi:hypothetical protein